MGQTLLDRLNATGNRPSGFDYMRVTLALLIICLHSNEISYGPSNPDDIYNSLWRGPAAALVPMFFALSGFLVAGSLERSRHIIIFVCLRILRIIPALGGVTVFAALVLGPLLTTYSLDTYFTDPRFFRYFQNIIGEIHYQLPGLFVGNPDTDATNAQLWTVPYELMFYIICALIALIGIYKRRFWMLGFVCFFIFLALLGADLEKHLRPWTVTGSTLLTTGLMGMLCYRFKKIIPWNFGLFLAAALVSLILLQHRQWDAFTPLPLTYATVYLGLLNPPRDKWVLSGDYSYGLYLYGWPLQQMAVSFGPAFQHWYINLLITIPSVIACAVASWWIIEKPALNLRVHLKRLEEKWR